MIEVTPFNLTQLPILTAAALNTIVNQILGQADSKEAKKLGKVTEAVEEGIELLQGKHAVFVVELQKRGKSESTIDADKAREADGEIDRGWRALHGFLGGIAELGSAHPAFAEVRVVRQRIYPDGLRFTQLKYLEEWSESQTRIDIIKSEKLDTVIEKVGGKPFLTFIRSAHAHYGKVLRVTTPRSVEQVVKLRASKEELQDALRFYVTQVVAMVRPSKPQTRALADYLLLPLTTWEPTKRAESESEGETEAPAPDGAPPVL